MTCEEFELRLDEALHRREPLKATEFAAHVSACDACQRSFEGAKRLSESIVASRANPPRIDLADRVVIRYLAERSHSRPAGGSRAWFRAAAAALATLAGLFGIVWLLGEMQAPPAPVVQNEPIAPKPVPERIEQPVVAESTPPVENAPPVEELVASARSAYLALAQNAANTLTDAAAVIVPEDASVPTLDALPKAPKLDVWQPTLPEGLGEWLDRRG